jgi:hypothetical protein
MELGELTAKLETLAGGKELAETVVNLVETEKQRGIQETGKRNKENQHLRRFKQSFEALGYDESVDLDGFTASLVKKVNYKPSDDDVSQSKLTLKTLNDQIQKLTNDLQNERNVSKTKTISAKLISSLTDKVYGADLLVKSLISDGQVDLQNDEVVFKHGENYVGFDEGIKNILEQRKDIVKNSQVPGSRTNGSGVSDIPRNINDLIANGSPEQIQANLAEIKKSLNLKI